MPTALVLLDLPAAFDTIDHVTHIRQYSLTWHAKFVANALVSSHLDLLQRSPKKSVWGKLTQTPMCPKHSGMYSCQPTWSHQTPSPSAQTSLASCQRSLHVPGSHIYIQIPGKWHFIPTFTPYMCNYNTGHSGTDKRFVSVPQFQPSLHRHKIHLIIVWHLMALHCGMPCVSTIALLLPSLPPEKGSNHTFWHGLPSLNTVSLHWCRPLLCPLSNKIA